MTSDIIGFIVGLAFGSFVTHQIWDNIHRERMYQQTIKTIRLMGKSQPIKEQV